MADAKDTNSTLPKKLRILCFGDSLTAGYSSYGMEHHPYANHLRVGLQHSLSISDIAVKVAGLSGDQVVDGNYLKRIKLVEKKQYDWIIVMGGTNDLGWGKEPETIYDGLKKVWTVALESGAKVLALNVIECARSNQALIQKRNRLNELIKDHREDRFYTFDLYSVIPYVGEGKGEELWDDGLHLTAEGYKVMGDAIAVGLFKNLQES